jgi:hypothetical protein
VGHGALGAATGKALLTTHYASIGLPSQVTPLVGWFEIGLGVAVAIRPAAPLLVFIVLWKLATESLFLVAGDRVWEVVERAGSYAAPLALAMLLARRRAGTEPAWRDMVEQGRKQSLSAAGVDGSGP